MNGEKRRYAPDCYAKEWSPLFSTYQNYEESRFYVEERRGLGGDADDLNIFLQEFEELRRGPSYLIEEFQEFCQGACLDDLKLGVGPAGERRAAWVDDRKWSPEPSREFVREYENPLTATDLFGILKAPVWNKS